VKDRLSPKEDENVEEKLPPTVPVDEKLLPV